MRWPLRTPLVFIASAIRAITSATGVLSSATPHGKNRFDKSVRNKNSFMPAAHSTSAGSGRNTRKSSPRGSWCSSRWVVGLSTGKRPFSASATMKKAKNASRWPVLSINSGSAANRVIMPSRLVVPARRAMPKSRSARSVRQARQSDLTARSHSAECAPGVKSHQGKKERAEQEEINESDNIPHETKRCAGAQHRDDERRKHHRSGEQVGRKTKHQEVFSETTVSFDSNFRISA